MSLVNKSTGQTAKEIIKEQEQEQIFKLKEELLPKKITIRQIIELMSREKYCYITKGGKSLYFSGKLKDIPKCLLDLDMIEISLKPKSDEYDIGFYVYPNEFLDLLNLLFENLYDTYKELYDECYNNYATKENPILAILEELKNPVRPTKPIEANFELDDSFYEGLEKLNQAVDGLDGLFESEERSEE